jgi:hypothetical protein
MDRKAFAVYTLIVGGLVGVLAQVLFYGKLIGVSFPLFIALAMIVVLASNGVLRQSLRLRNLWVLAPALFFAIMVAIRTDATITLLNIATALALGALALYYLPFSHHLDLSTVGDHLFGLLDATFGVIFAPIFELWDSTSWLLNRLDGNWRVVASVGRGLLIAAPVLLVFALLLASADAVFADYVDQVMTFLTFPNLNVEFYRIAFIGAFGWLACGTIAYGVARRKPLQPNAEEDKPKRKRFSLGLIEACITLGSIDLLFGLFVAIQFRYFFGGEGAIGVAGMTYSQYARRGFFELVAISLMTLCLVLLLDNTTMRRAARHTTVFRALAVVLVGLTGVLLLSAAQRMLLYEAAYGFTPLRVYTHVFMLWLGVLFGFFLLALFRVRMQIFSLGVLVVIIGYLGTLNLMNVEGYIAERNIARAADGYEIDWWYLNTLSADATPAVLNLFNAQVSSTMHDAAGQWLAGKLVQLDYTREGEGATAFSANLARNSAWAALNAIRDQLPEYNPAYFYRSDWLSGRGGLKLTQTGKTGGSLPCRRQHPSPA